MTIPNPEPDLRSLKEAAGDRYKIGVGVGNRILEKPEDAALIRKHFQILTPENCMKPQSIHPAETRWNFQDADRFVELARANKLEVVGHCLVWAKDDRTDEWMKQEDGKPVSRETLLRRIETHVETVVGRYADVADDVGRGQRGGRGQRRRAPARLGLLADDRHRLPRDGVQGRSGQRPRRLAHLQRLQRQQARQAQEGDRAALAVEAAGSTRRRLRHAGSLRAWRGADPAAS